MWPGGINVIVREKAQKIGVARILDDVDVPKSDFVEHSGMFLDFQNEPYN